MQIESGRTGARGARRAIAWLAFAFSVSACSLAQDSQVRVQVRLPEGSARIEASGNADDRGLKTPSELETWKNSLQPPTSLDEFRCFAINLSGVGIPKNTSLTSSCTAADSPDLPRPQWLAGTVSEGAGFDLQVPSGTGRVFQLIGFRMADADLPCPKIEDLISGALGPDGIPIHDRMDGPFELALAKVDVLGDTTVELKLDLQRASRKTCLNGDEGGGGGSSSGRIPDAVYRGALAVGYVSAPSAMPPNFLNYPNPTVPGAPEIGGLATSSLSVLSTFNGSNSGGPPPYDSASAIVHQATAAAERAVIQAQWKIDPAVVAADPYVRIRLAYTGGAKDGSGTACFQTSTADDWNPVRQGAAIGVFSGSGPSVIEVEPFFQPSQLKYTTLHRRLSDVLYSKAGESYVIVNLESRWVALSAGGCMPWVALDAATLEFSSVPRALQIYSNGLSSFVAGQSVYVRAEGGRGPYTFSVASPGVLDHPSLSEDGENHLRVNASGATTIVVSVTDANGTIVNKPFVVDQAMPVGLAFLGATEGTASTPFAPAWNSSPMPLNEAFSGSGYALALANIGSNVAPYYDLYFALPPSAVQSLFPSSTVDLQFEAIGGMSSTCSSSLPDSSFGVNAAIWNFNSNAWSGGVSDSSSVMSPISISGLASNVIGLHRPVNAVSTHLVVVRVVHLTPASSQCISLAIGTGALNATLNP